MRECVNSDDGNGRSSLLVVIAYPFIGPAGLDNETAQREEKCQAEPGVSD